MQTFEANATPIIYIFQKCTEKAWGKNSDKTTSMKYCLFLSRQSSLFILRDIICIFLIFLKVALESWLEASTYYY